MSAYHGICATILYLGLLCPLLGSSSAIAQSDQTLQLQATFLYRFAQFTQWPPPPRHKLRFCIDANPALLQQLRQLVPAASAEVHDWQQASSAQCDVLMLSAQSDADPAYWHSVLRQHPLLIVTDQPALYRQAGIIRLFTTTEGIHFDINLPRARQHGIHLSAQLLKLARSVD